MNRNPFTEPVAGDVIHHPTFGGGCSFVVIKTMDRKGWGYSVQAELHPDDGRRVKPERRIYSIDSWASFKDKATVSALENGRG